MTEKELRKLNRYQLLELLVVQTRRAEELQKKLEELENTIQERDIRLSKLGSIAEASLQVSGIFEASQKAVDLYWDSVRKQAIELLEDAQRQAEEIVKSAEVKAKYISVLQQDSLDE
ncbi:MAG: hypothetical protein IJE22_00650 [Oscillibacter sp.]|nr:hypothetical protein [Oscillibacter sp.]